MEKVKKIIILQARCRSKRFPFKSLYPINNLPLAIYCAKRLTYKSNFNLILATSLNKDDDYLIKLAKKFKIKYFRGSEKNVLSRFIEISKNYNDDAILIRATADNPLTDSDFIEKCMKIFFKYKLSFFFS